MYIVAKNSSDRARRITEEQLVAEKRRKEILTDDGDEEDEAPTTSGSSRVRYHHRRRDQHGNVGQISSVSSSSCAVNTTSSSLKRKKKRRNGDASSTSSSIVSTWTSRRRRARMKTSNRSNEGRTADTISVATSKSSLAGSVISFIARHICRQKNQNHLDKEIQSKRSTKKDEPERTDTPKDIAVGSTGRPAVDDAAAASPSDLPVHSKHVVSQALAWKDAEQEQEQEQHWNGANASNSMDSHGQGYLDRLGYGANTSFPVTTIEEEDIIGHDNDFDDEVEATAKRPSDVSHPSQGHHPPLPSQYPQNQRREQQHRHRSSPTPSVIEQRKSKAETTMRTITQMIQVQEKRENDLEVERKRRFLEAKEKLAAGNKRAAVRNMRTVRLLTQEREKISSAIDTMEAQVLSIESLLFHGSVVNVLTGGSETLKNPGDDATAVFDDIKDGIAYATEVQEILSQPLANDNFDEESLLMELMSEDVPSQIPTSHRESIRNSQDDNFVKPIQAEVRKTEHQKIPTSKRSDQLLENSFTPSEIAPSRTAIKELIDGTSLTPAKLSASYVGYCTERFAEHLRLDHGAIGGAVYRGVDREIGCEFVVKAVTREILNDRDLEDIVREVEKVSLHPNMLLMCGYCPLHFDNSRFFVYDYPMRGSLDQYLHDGAGRALLSSHVRVSILHQLARCVNFLHSRAGTNHQQLHHVLIECANVYLDDDMSIQLADSGLAQSFPCSPKVPTSLLSEFGMPSAVYAIGIIMIELILGRLLDGSGLDTWETLFDGADPVVEWDHMALESLCKVAVRCTTRTPRISCSTLVCELHKIHKQEILGHLKLGSVDVIPGTAVSASGRHTCCEDAWGVEAEDNFGGVGVLHGSGSEIRCCRLCYRETSSGLVCENLHPTCVDCIEAKMLGLAKTGRKDSIRCDVRRCRSESFRDEDLVGRVGRDVFQTYMRQSDIQEAVVQDTASQAVASEQAHESMSLLAGQLKRCPSVVWLVPATGEKVSSRPMEWAKFQRKYSMYFICQRSFTAVNAPIDIQANRQWLVQIAPALKASLIYLRKSIVANDNVDDRPSTLFPFPFEESDVESQLTKEALFVDSLFEEEIEWERCLEIFTATNAVSVSDRVKSLVGPSYELIANKANEPKHSHWRSMMKLSFEKGRYVWAMVDKLKSSSPDERSNSTVQTTVTSYTAQEKLDQMQEENEDLRARMRLLEKTVLGLTSAAATSTDPAAASAMAIVAQDQNSIEHPGTGAMMTRMVPDDAVSSRLKSFPSVGEHGMAGFGGASYMGQGYDQSFAIPNAAPRHHHPEQQHFVVPAPWSTSNISNRMAGVDLTTTARHPSSHPFGAAGTTSTAYSTGDNHNNFDSRNQNDSTASSGGGGSNNGQVDDELMKSLTERITNSVLENLSRQQQQQQGVMKTSKEEMSTQI